MKTTEQKIERIRKYAKSAAESLKKLYDKEEVKDDKEEILGQIIIYDNVETLLKETLDILDIIKIDISRTIESYKKIYNDAKFGPAKNLFWGYVLALETLEMLLEFDKLKEDTKWKVYL